MKKKIFSIILMLVFLLPTFVFLSGCKENNNNQNIGSFNLENSIIKNFSNYSNIGVAYVYEDSASTVSYFSNKKVAYAYQKKKKTKIIGKNKNGDYEEIKYEDEDGKEIEQVWQVKDMISLGKYIFMNYTSKDNFTFNSFDNENNPGTRPFTLINSEDTKSYIVDSLTGKVYSTEELCEKIDYLEMNPDYGYLGYSNEYIYVLKTSYYVNNMVNYYEIFKIYTHNNDLIVKKIIDNSALNFNDRDMLVDCYGNVYLKKLENYGINSYNFLITCNEELKQLDDLYLIKDIKSVISYSTGYPYKTREFDKNGNVIEYDYEKQRLNDFFEVISKKDNITYHFCENKHVDGQLRKVVWDDDGNYIVEQQYNLDRDYEKWAYTSDKIYFLNSSSVFYYDLNTHTYTNISSGYIFNNIKVGYDNNIIFTGLNSQLQQVKGIIKNDSSVEIEISDLDYEILYIKPLN